MKKTEEEIIVEISRQSTPVNKRNSMKILGVAVNVEHNIRTSMENEQMAKVLASRQEFEE